MKLRYLVDRDLTQKNFLEISNTAELKKAVLELLKKSITKGKEIEVRGLDSFLIIYNGDFEKATIKLRSSLRGKHHQRLHKPRLIRQGKKNSYNSIGFYGLGVHLNIFDMAYILKAYIDISNQDIIDTILSKEG